MPEAPSVRTFIDCQGASDVGRVRGHNEDKILVSSGCRWLIVADGMGGYEGGEVASQLAVDAAHQYLKAHYTADWSVARASEVLEAAVVCANKAVVDGARQQETLASMGSTLLIVASCGEGMVSSHVGDSRLYRYQDGVLKRLTTDHTVIEACIEAGVVSANEARLLGVRGSLTRGLGVREDVTVDTNPHVASSGARILLCTDGLTDMIDDDQIKSVLARCNHNADAVSALIDAANQNGGRDNISVILATLA